MCLSCPFHRAADGRPMLERITALVNSVLKEEGAAEMKPEDVVKLIGECWRHGNVVRSVLEAWKQTLF